MKKKNETTRLPRPYGLTQVMAMYHKAPLEEKPGLEIKARNFMIQNWLLSSGLICGRIHSINDLAKFLLCDISDIQVFMRDRLLSTKIWDKDVQENMMEGLVGQQIMWALEDRVDIQGQLDILRQSQNGKYTPFVSGEVNKALKLKLESSSSLQSLVRAMAGNSTVNIFNPVQNNLINNEVSGINQEEALALIQKTILELPEGQEHNDLKYVEAKYDFDSLPKVVATDQGDIGVDKEGLKLMKRDNNKILDNYKFHLSNEAEAEHHEIRREIELGIEEDAEDTEFEEYEE